MTTQHDNDADIVINNNNNNNNNQQPSKNPALDPTSPYFLHPAENPALVLVSPPLKENNYDSWSRAMQRALLSKNKLKFVNGKLPRPLDDDPLSEVWDKCNNIVLSWLAASISPDIAQSTIYIDNATVLWTELNNRFSKGDYFRISDLLQKIHSMRQGDKTVSVFFNDIKTTWEDLEILRTIPSCTCGASKSFKNQRDMEFIICFLKGLNDTYNNVKSNILMMEPIPEISKVYSSVLQQERQSMDVTIPDSSTILYSHSSQINQRRQPYKKQQWRGNSSQNIKNNSKNCSYWANLAMLWTHVISNMVSMIM